MLQHCNMFAFIPMIPTALIGFYFEHEDEIKAKMEKQKNSENQKDNNIQLFYVKIDKINNCIDYR